MTLSEKIRTIRENREWTQAQLSERLNLSESTVQKWEVAKSTPPYEAIKELAKVLDTSICILTDEDVEVFPIFEIESSEMLGRPGGEDSEHSECLADLKRGARLHRFLNHAGEAYSAIYIGSYEQCSCVREHEHRMIDYWNEIN